MLERWETYDRGGLVTGYVLKEIATAHSGAGRPAASEESESLLANTVCLIVGLIILMPLVVFAWLIGAAS